MPKYSSPRDWFKEELDAARSPEITPGELDVLSESPHEAVRLAVVEHPNTEPRTLAGFVPLNIQSPFDLDLAAALARNSNTPDYALQRLAARLMAYMDREPDQARSFEACVALSSNPNTPFEAISMLLAPNRSEIELRKAVARETRRPDVLRLLQSDRSEVVRKQALKSPESIASTLGVADEPC